jgi:hypothetical protein
MLRPKATAYLLAPMLVALAILASACGGHPEQPQLQQFFRASALSDSQTLSSFAAVNFDPKTDGQVTGFTIVSVSEPRVEPLKIKELAKAVADAQAAEREFNDRKREYQDAHPDALKRVLDAEAANKPVSRADAVVQAEWTKWQQDTGAVSKKISEAQSQLSSARPLAELSLSTPQGPLPDLSKVDGQMESKDVTITATIKMPNGSTTERNLVVTMQRAVMKATPADKPGRWIFTAVKPA